MRKALSFVLVLALIMGSFSFAFAADTESTTYSDIAGKDCEGAVTVLSAIGVVNGYADGTYKPEKVVTRAEMAKLLIVALGMDEYVKGTYTSFSDVKNHWANSYIAYAASMGIIEGYPDGTFRPDNTVTYQEAITMVVRALGYQDQYLTGTWPASHVSMAKALGILDDIVATAAGANRGDVAILIYNALDKDTVTYSSTGQLVESEGTAMLDRLGATPHSRTILDADGLGNIGYADGVDLSEFYGYSVIPYTIENDDDEDVIIAVGDIKGTAYEVQLKTDGSFEYNDKNYGIVGDYSVLVNNYLVDKNIPLITVDEKGDIDATMATVIVNGSLSNDNTKLYSVIQWQVSEPIWVDEDLVDDIAAGLEDKDDFTIGDNSNNVVWNDDDSVFDVIVTGAAADLGGIKEDDVIFVYNKLTYDKQAQEIKAGDVEKIAVAREVVEGNISKANKTLDEFTISGKKYDLSDYAKEANLDKLATDNSVGEDYTVYFDPNGKIFAAEKKDSKGDYALVIATDTKNNFGKDTKKIKVMDNTGAVVELTLKGEGAPVANDEGDVEYSGEATSIADVVTGSIITYATNSAGKVTEIEKFKTTTVDEKTKMTKKGVYGNKEVADDVVVFTFDGNIADLENDEDKYDVGSLKKIVGEEFLATYVYDDDDKEIVAMIVGKNVGGSDDTFGLINSVSTVKNKDDDKVFEYEALVDGKEVNLTANTDVKLETVSDVLNNGPLFVFTADNEGIVTGIKPVNKEMKFANDDDIEMLVSVFAPVTAIDKTKGTINVGEENSYSIGDNVIVYKATLDKNDEFDCFTIGSLSNVATDAFVIMFDTTDDDEATADIIVVVTRADAKTLKMGDEDGR